MVSKTARVLSNLQKKKRLDILKPEETLQWMDAESGTRVNWKDM